MCSLFLDLGSAPINTFVFEIVIPIVGIESVLVVLNMEILGIAYNGNDVELTRLVNFIFVEIGIGRSEQVADFFFVDSFFGGHKLVCASRFNFNKNDKSQLFGDNIQIAVSQMPIHVKNMVTMEQ